MGVLNGLKCLFSLNSLSLDHVKQIAKRMAIVNGRDDGHPRIFVDESWFERKKPNRCADIIGILKAAGFDVTVVFDPPSRHHSKVASISRSGKREKARLEAYSARFEAKLVSNQLMTGLNSNDERVVLEKKLEELHAKAKRNENASVGSLLTPTFVQDLTEQLTKLADNNYGCQVNWLTGSYQADSVISSYVESGGCDIVLSPDSDFSFVGGAKCLQICDFKLTNSTLSGFVVKSGSKMTIQLAVDSANILQGPTKKLSYLVPDFPILDGLVDARLRCVVSVILGCDTFPGGVSGVGPAKIAQILEGLISNNDMSESALFKKSLEYGSGKGQYDSIDLTIATDAMFYEPADSLDEKNNDTGHKYIFNSPIGGLDHYLSDFSNEPTLDSNERTALCHGHSSMAPHNFLCCFGRTCATCHKVACIFCMVTSKGGSYECLLCMGGDVPDELVSDELRKQIDECHFNLAHSEGTITELRELHDAVVTKKMLNMGRHALCKYPLLVSESLHDNNLLGGHHLCRFSFSAGGQFVQDSSLGVESIIGVTHIFAALVGFTNKYITNDKSTSHVRISQCIPDLINKFAEGSRSSGGERLKKRAVRHAFDLKTDPLDCKAIGAIFKQGATGTGLVITHTVSPSFRQDTKYAVCVAITADDLLAAECNCKAGCSGKDKHICVHILPVLLQLSILLYDALAENFLVELSSRWNSLRNDFRILDPSAQKAFIVSIKELMETNRGLTSNERTSDDPSFLLANFNVGTEKAKRMGGAQAPDPKDLRPIREYEFNNPTRKVKKLKEIKTKNTTTVYERKEGIEEPDKRVEEDLNNNHLEEDDESNDTSTEVIDYCAVQALCTAITLQFESDYSDLEKECIGYQIINKRNNKQAISKVIWESVIRDSLCRVQHSLFPATTKRCKQYRAKKRMLQGTVTTTEVTPIKKSKSNPSIRIPCLPEEAEVTPPRNSRSNPFSDITIIKKKKKGGRKCCMFGGKCPGTFVQGSKSKTVPSAPTYPSFTDDDGNLKTDAIINNKLQIYGRRKFYHNEVKRRTGMAASRLRDLRICKLHTWSQIRKSYVHEIVKDGKVVGNKTVTAEFNLPSDAGPKMTGFGTYSNGLGVERFQASLLGNCDGSDGQGWKKLTQQYSEMEDARTSSPDSGGVSVSPVLLRACGLECHPEFRSPATKDSNCLLLATVTDQSEPAVTPVTLSDREVKGRTGFKSLALLISYVAVICNGDINKMMERETSLTWFEEWFLFFQWIWGRETHRMESLARLFKSNTTTVRTILRTKTQRIKKTMELWPRFVSIEEDRALMEKKWKSKYDNMRILFWDNTNVNVPASSDPNINRHTYSHYYNGTVAKGAVFLQLCGWMGTWELFAGTISDSDYQKSSKVFEATQQFANNDRNESLLPFTNIVDKGYRCGIAAWRAGKQLVLQPVFAKSDTKFNSQQVHRSANVAADRSANERAVKMAKHSNLIKRGLEQYQQPKTIADAWLVWGFQTNFMFKSVMGV